LTPFDTNWKKRSGALKLLHIIPFVSYNKAF
jgi:hypothetical protein